MNTSARKLRPFECRDEIFWYLVGLIAADGCLSKNGRTIDITGEKDHLAALKYETGIRSKVGLKSNGRGQFYHRIQIGSRDLYAKLLEIGLTQRKSLTLGALFVPDAGFSDFLRGVIDGDGNIYHWRHPRNGREQWRLFVCGASRGFLEWLSETVARMWHVSGRLHVQRDAGRNHPLYKLKYGKLAARVIFSKCYRPGAFALERKRALAHKCVLSPVGWSRSKTVSAPESWRGWKYQRTWGGEVVSRVLDRKEALGIAVAEAVHY